MAKQVPWNKIIVEEFITLAMLTKDEERIIRTRAQGWSITEQALKFGMSTTTVARIVKRLKIKYDRVQPYSVILPPRKRSAAELYEEKIILPMKAVLFLDKSRISEILLNVEDEYETFSEDNIVDVIFKDDISSYIKNHGDSDFRIDVNYGIWNSAEGLVSEKKFAHVGFFYSEYERGEYLWMHE